MPPPRLKATELTNSEWPICTISGGFCAITCAIQRQRIKAAKHVVLTEYFIFHLSTTGL
jgi:hypothetical protein